MIKSRNWISKYYDDKKSMMENFSVFLCHCEDLENGLKKYLLMLNSIIDSKLKKTSKDVEIEILDMFSYFVDEYEWFIDENIEWIKENNILLFTQGELLAEKYNEIFLDESFKQIDIKAKEHAEYLLNKLLQFEGIKVASLNIDGENRYISLYKDETSEHQKENVRKEILFCFCLAMMKNGTVIARSFSNEGVLNVFGIVGYENNKWLPIEKEKLYDILEYNRDTVNNKPVTSIYYFYYPFPYKFVKC